MLKKIKALKRINYCAVFIKEEYDLIKEAYNFNHKWLWYTYYNIEDTFENHIYKDKMTDNILIGNSANPSNNHIDAFKILTKFDLLDRKIICPLSYGESIPGYVENVISEGKNLFGRNFLPLTQFLPLKDYNAILGTCGIVIMNQNRQQAVGNIISALWNGAKLYLNNRNTVYKYLKSRCIFVYSIQEELTPLNPDALKSIQMNKIMQNRLVLENSLSKKSVYRNVSELINILQS